MKKFALVFAATALCAFAGEWKGTISDAGCAAKHADASEKSQACVKKCCEGGAAAVFVTEDGKVLKIDNQDAVKAHWGHKVTVTGSVTGESVHVDSVKM